MENIMKFGKVKQTQGVDDDVEAFPLNSLISKSIAETYIIHHRDPMKD